MINQEGDILLFHKKDGGDITIENGVVSMSGGLETAVYLSLFGHIRDGLSLEGNNGWWGDLIEEDPARKLTCETNRLLSSIPATSYNIQRIKDAVLRDLQWLEDKGIVSTIEVALSIPQKNVIHIDLSLEARGSLHNFNYTENWQATQ